MKASNNQTGSIFPLGTPGSAEWFGGEVHVQTLVTPEDMEGLYTVGQVTFSPGGRTHWHTHPLDQVLLVTEGNGWYQERDKPAQVLTKGTTIAIPKNVEHWHGASANNFKTDATSFNVASFPRKRWPGLIGSHLCRPGAGQEGLAKYGEPLFLPTIWVWLNKHTETKVAENHSGRTGRCVKRC